MNQDQDKVIERLAEAGWISRTWESESKLMIQWTEYGIEQLYKLGEILRDAGFDLMNKKQIILFCLIARLSTWTGTDENNVSVIDGKLENYKE